MTSYADTNTPSVSILPASGLAQDEQGYTLLQVIVALAVMGVLTVTVGPGIMDKLESFIAISQSSTQEKVADLAKRYTTDNNQAVMTATAGGAIEVTMQDLRTANLLSASEVDASGARPEVFNSYGARMIVLARNVGGTGLEVITYPLGGTDSSLQADADVVTALGGRAGFVLSGEAECGAGITLCAKGNGGNWSINLAHFDNAATNAVLPSGGEVITLDYIGQGQVTGPELYRTAVAGRPELNQMATDLDGGGNDLTGFDELRPVGTAPGLGIGSAETATLYRLSADHSTGAAAVAATASTLAIRGADGTLIAAEPTADTHLATKGYVDGASGGGASAPCGDSPTIGQVCDDGTTYIGRHTKSGNRLYISPTTAATRLRIAVYPQRISMIGSSQLNPFLYCSMTTTYVSDGCYFGEENTSFYHSAFQSGGNAIASNYCSNLVVHEHDDYYLPSLMELMQIFLARHKLPSGYIQFSTPYLSSSARSTTEVHTLILENNSNAPQIAPNNGSALILGTANAWDDVQTVCVRQQ